MRSCWRLITTTVPISAAYKGASNRGSIAMSVVLSPLHSPSTTHTTIAHTHNNQRRAYRTSRQRNTTTTVPTPTTRSFQQSVGDPQDEAGVDADDGPRISEPDDEWATMIQDAIGEDGSVDFESLAMSSTLASTTIRTSKSGFTWVDITANVSDFSNTIQIERRHTALSQLEKNNRGNGNAGSSMSKNVAKMKSLAAEDDRQWETLIAEIVALKDEVTRTEEEAAALVEKLRESRRKAEKEEEEEVDRNTTDGAKATTDGTSSSQKEGKEGTTKSEKSKSKGVESAKVSAAGEKATTKDEGNEDDDAKGSDKEAINITGEEDEELLNTKLRAQQERQLLGVKRAIFRERLYERYLQLVDRQKHTMTDAEFVVVIRERLEFYGVPRRLLGDVSKMILLPQTMVELKETPYNHATATTTDDDGARKKETSSPSTPAALAVCLVCRFAKQHPKSYLKHINSSSAPDATILTRLEMLASDVSSSQYITPTSSKHSATNSASQDTSPSTRSLWDRAFGVKEDPSSSSTSSPVLTSARRRAIAKQSLLKTFQTAKDKALVDSNKLLGNARRRQGGLRAGNVYMGRASSEKSNAVRGQKNGRTFETIQQLSHRLTVFLLPDSNTAVTVHKFSIAGLEGMHSNWGENLNRLTMDGFLRKVAIECAQSFLDLERERAVDVDMLEMSLFEDVERLGAVAPEVDLDGDRRRSTAATTSNRHKNFTQDLEPTKITMLIAMFRELNPMSFLRASSRAETFKSTLNDLYGVTREASASCRILRNLYDVVEQARIAANLNDKNNDAVVQRIDAARSMSEGLREQTQSLLSLQFSVAANQLENLMRMLTVFSTLFTPLGLLVSICGLNFLVMESFYGDERNLYGLLVVGACVLGLTRYWMKTSGVF